MLEKNYIKLERELREMKDKLKIIEEYVAQNNPTTPLDIALGFAYLKATAEVTQAEYSKVLGISDRSVRKYISDNKTEYDEEFAKWEAEKVPEVDIDNLSRTLTEEQLDKFIDGLVRAAISPNATVRERQQLIDFAGLTADDLLNLQAVKAKSIRWFIKQNLSNISHYMNTKELGITLQSSQYLYHGDKESVGNSKRFMSASLEDESFKLELMLAGLTFYSLYNSVEHPDLELMQTIVKLDRLEKGINEPMNMRELKGFAKGENILDQENKTKTKASELATKKRLDELLVEIDNLTKHIPKAKKVNASDYRNATEKVVKLTKTPDLPDVEEVEKRATEHYEELQVLLSTEDLVRSWIEESKRKHRWS
ncbi:hypothetical protein [Fictibacillus phosphorivorans]|uniref:hypothetical protein n=1 Tax=Fictibacillus phosphorivorans TaxID=1221500 RepID=UPI0035E860C2